MKKLAKNWEINKIDESNLVEWFEEMYSTVDE